MTGIRVYAPATVANVSCGFDAMGYALDRPGDVVDLYITETPGIVLQNEVKGINIPLEPENNSTSVALQVMLNALPDPPIGLRIVFKEKIWPGSGIGSSSASAAAGVYALNELLNRPFSRHKLVEFAMEGERAACGAAHADNVAPALLGGFILIRGYDPLDLIELHAPAGMFTTIVMPEVVVRTEDARKVLPTNIPLKTAIQQWGNVGGLVAGLAKEDFELMKRSLVDLVAEPARKVLIPHFDKVKQAALNVGVIGCGISGSGPSIFALTHNIDTAEAAQKAMSAVYQKAGINYQSYTSAVNPVGPHVIEKLQ